MSATSALTVCLDGFYVLLFEISDSYEELMEWEKQFKERISYQDKETIKLQRQGADQEETNKVLSSKINQHIIEISKLQSELDVSLLYYRRDISLGNYSF